MTIALATSTDVQLRIPGDLFRAVNPRTFSSPQLRAERHEVEFGTIYAVTAKVEGIPETFDLLYSIDAEFNQIQKAVDEFNADTILGWAGLLKEFFREQRAKNAERRALLDQDESFLFNLEAGFLR